MIHRLITCQGTAQLATALAALERRRADSQSSGMAATCDYLLVFGLAVNDKQVNEFEDFIKRMALLIHPFKKVCSLSNSEIDSLQKLCPNNGQVVNRFKAMTGIHSVDEVFVVRDWQVCNELVLDMFPKATHICYGDSVGIYFSRPENSNHYSQFRNFFNGFLSPLRLGRKIIQPPSRLDICYLLLPDAFGTPVCTDVIKTRSTDLLNVYKKTLPLINESWRIEIRRRVEGQAVWVLMGSNFSEQGLMTIDQEIAAYRDWMLSLVSDTTIYKLLIKSHPRDIPEKSNRLLDALKNDFSEVILLDDAAGQYIPVEVLLLEISQVVRRVECLAVSTACLGSGLVLGLPVRIGLGGALVSKYFPAAVRASRDRHEAELKEICSRTEFRSWHV